MHIIRTFLVHWLVIAVAVGVCAAALPSVQVHGGVGSLIATALLFGVVNAVIGPILRLLTLPVTLVTFGLFALVVNGVLLAITAWWSDSLDVGGPLQTIAAALVISMLSAVIGAVVNLSRRRRHRHAG